MIAPADAGGTRRLPLWKNAVDDLVSSAVTYGDTVSVEWFEAALSEKRDTLPFELGVSRVRRALEQRGLYLSGEGRKSSGVFTVLPANRNADVVESYGRQMVDVCRRAVALGSATDRKQLTGEEIRVIDAKVQRMATRLALIQRQKSIEKAVAKHAPKLLQK